MRCVLAWHARLYRFKYYLLAALVFSYLLTCVVLPRSDLPFGLLSSLGARDASPALPPDRSPRPPNDTFCRFNYGLGEWPWGRARLPDPLPGSPDLGDAGPFRVLYNAVEASDNATAGGGAVTFCTHATADFVWEVAEVARRWNGPVSLAVYAPGSDGALALSALRRLCRCLPETARLSAHLVFPAAHPPDLAASAVDDPAPEGCAPPPRRPHTFRARRGLSYPVNAARNVARAAAATPYVLVSDIELLPSKGLARGLGALLARAGADPPPASAPRPAVFVVPVFEVEARVRRPPDSKTDLLRLYDNNEAFYFHRWLCPHCQRFPGLLRWLRRPPRRAPDGLPLVEPLLSARREFPFHRWEPVFVGTAADPLYSELLSWEGRQDKMAQVAEMCLRGYRFVILDGAFLVHAPGVKRPPAPGAAPAPEATPSSAQRDHERRNAEVYARIAEGLARRFPSRAGHCRVGRPTPPPETPPKPPPPDAAPDALRPAPRPRRLWKPKLL